MNHRSSIGAIKIEEVCRYNLCPWFARLQKKLVHMYIYTDTNPITLPSSLALVGKYLSYNFTSSGFQSFLFVYNYDILPLLLSIILSHRINNTHTCNISILLISMSVGHSGLSQ